MILIILGLVLLVVSATVFTERNRLERFAKASRAVGILLLVSGILISATIQIEPGEVGVKSLFGKVQDDVLESGLHLINPMLKIHRFDIRTRNYTMSGVHDEGMKTGDDAIRVLSNDGLEVVIDLTLLYSLDPKKAPVVLKEIGVEYEDKFIRPLSRTRIRDNAVYYTAVDLYSTHRDEFQNRIYTNISKDFNKRGLILDQLLIRNITLPASVKATIESKINAEQEAQKMQFILQKEKLEADRKRVEARGIADYQAIINSELTDKLLQYESIKAYKELASSSNAKIIVMPSKGNTPIILDAK